MSEPLLAMRTCARRLERAGLPAGSSSEISWFGPAAYPEEIGAEAVVQAICGLMELNGREEGRPFPFGIEACSVAAGVLGAQAALAARIGQARGLAAPAQTSVLQAGALLASHYVALATAGQVWGAPPGWGPGPPFVSSDGIAFELDTLAAESWRAFWTSLGLEGAEVGWSWMALCLRHPLAFCPLPVSLHQAAGARTFDQLSAAAGRALLSLTRVRAWEEAAGLAGQVGEAAEVHRLGPGRPATAALLESSPGLPLSGFRVVESTTRVQGPLAGLLLSMLGAEVIKVEPPGGDPARIVAPIASGTGVIFSCFNRGKEAVCLDLKSASGRAGLIDLVAGADVFLHNWRPGKQEEWNLGPAELAAGNPRLVYAAASGWGPLEAQLGLLGTDSMVQAWAGLLDGRGRPSRVLLVDFMGGLVAAEGILAALWRREQEGGAWRAESSLLSGAVTLHSGRSPAMQHPIPAASGYLAIAASEDKHQSRLAEMFGLDHAGMPPAGLEALVSSGVGTGSAASWARRMEEAGIPAAEVCTDLAALPRSPRLRGIFEPLAGGPFAAASPWTG